MCDPRPGEVNWTCLPVFHLNAIVVTLLYSVVSGTTAAITPRFSLSGFWADIEKSGASVASVLGSMIPLIANYARQRGNAPLQGAVENGQGSAISRVSYRKSGGTGSARRLSGPMSTA